MTVHVAAIVKALEEGDSTGTRHFGSTMAFNEHVNRAFAAGVVEAPYDDRPYWRPVLTDLGRQEYVRLKMAELPPGRANNWRWDETK